MEDIIGRIEKLKECPKMVRDKNGKEFFLNVSIKKGLLKENVEERLKKRGIMIPEDLEKLYSFSNGVSFFEYFDCSVYDLDTAISLGIRDEKYLCIGNYFGDNIYVNCKEKDDTVYYSLEGIEDLESTELSFKEFMRESLRGRFFDIWYSWE